MKYVYNLHHAISLVTAPYLGPPYYWMYVTRPTCDTVTALAMARDRLRCRLAARTRTRPTTKKEPKPVFDFWWPLIVLCSLNTGMDIRRKSGNTTEEILSSEHLEMMWTPGPY